MEYLGKIDVLERYQEVARSPSVEIRFPAVARITTLMVMNRKDIKFSRTNVYARDRWTCQYCGKRPSPKELTYDHVMPRSKGGKTNFENIVTCCKSCNKHKANRTPHQAGMKLIAQPRKPVTLPMSSIGIVLPKDIPDLWMPYLNDKIAGVRVG